MCSFQGFFYLNSDCFHRFHRATFRFHVCLSPVQKPSTRNNAIRPVVQVARECPEDLSQKRPKRYPLISHTASESPETTTHSQQAASSSSAASEPSYANTPRFVITDTTLKRENVYGSIDKNLNTATTTV